MRRASTYRVGYSICWSIIVALYLLLPKLAGFILVLPMVFCAMVWIWIFTRDEAREKASRSTGGTGGGPRFRLTRQFFSWLKDHAKDIAYSIVCVVSILEVMPGIYLVANWITDRFGVNQYEMSWVWLALMPVYALLVTGEYLLARGLLHLGKNGGPKAQLQRLVARIKRPRAENLPNQGSMFFRSPKHELGAQLIAQHYVARLL